MRHTATPASVGFSIPNAQLDEMMTLVTFLPLFFEKSFSEFCTFLRALGSVVENLHFSGHFVRGICGGQDRG
ncbi:hypothetical protein [Hyphomicrobium sp. 99]|uniref:hypothetical protein n=1 Tax=Hyphomicrobium sp. 99 TaxID=1163419 RepID=UPI0005F80148|nr:hypothetical protein [Hyphomicrobium sp. 99]